MAFQSAFSERLKDMDNSRHQRLSLLQAEKDLQTNKSQILSAKLSQIRQLEQHCFLLDHKLTSQNFKILSLKSEIEFLDRKYQNLAVELRKLKIEVEELEKLEQDRETQYGDKRSEMNEFKDGIDEFTAQIRNQVKELKLRRDEIISFWYDG